MSSSAFNSASFTIFSISSSDRPLPPWIVIDCSLFDDLSLAETAIFPFASISNVTSIWGVPLGAAGMSVRLNCPKDLLSEAFFLSPCNTCTVTAVWLSSAVEKTCDLFVGIVVFFSISGVITPPKVSIPNVKGVTSNNNTSDLSPLRTAPWVAAPKATASSGLISFLASLPKKSATVFWTIGILVCPPTRITSLISFGLSFASFKAVLTGSKLLVTKSPTKDSSLALVIFCTKCFGPLASAVM